MISFSFLLGICGLVRGLAVRHDHGSQYMSDAFQKELAFLGIESSHTPTGPTCFKGRPKFQTDALPEIVKATAATSPSM